MVLIYISYIYGTYIYIFSALCVQLTHPLLLLSTSKICVQYYSQRLLLLLRSAVTMTQREQKYLESPQKKT